MSLRSPVIDSIPDTDGEPRKWCAACRARTPFRSDRGGYPLCLRCENDEPEEPALPRDETREQYIERRSKQIHDDIMARLSLDDFATALRMIADTPGVLELVRNAVFLGDELLPGYMHGAVAATMRQHSVGIAITEARVLYDMNDE